MTILVFILVLSLLVIIHEAGHFLLAKKHGVKVHEFGFGYPPKLIKLFHWRGTDFTFNHSYSCRCRRGYSPHSDPFNVWRRQIEPTDCSRKDIAFSYRLGGGF